MIAAFRSTPSIVVLGILCSAGFQCTPANASDGEFPGLTGKTNYTLNDQRGPWKLTDITMQSLLDAGFELKSTETTLAISLGTSVGKLSDVQATDAAYAAYYLQKGGALFKCTEEQLGARVVICWRFSPVAGQINGRDQRDAPINPLIGEWTGAIIQMNGKAQPVYFKFTDAHDNVPAKLETDCPDIPSETVTFNLGPTTVDARPTDGNHWGSVLHFNILSETQASLSIEDKPTLGGIFLRKKGPVIP